MLRKEELRLHRDLCVFLNNNVFSYVKVGNLCSTIHRADTCVSNACRNIGIVIVFRVLSRTDNDVS